MNNKNKITPKAGMKLKTREGKDAMIYHIHDQKTLPIHGAILLDHLDHWTEYSWDIDGSSCILSKKPHGNDLIFEYELDFDWSVLPKGKDKYIAMDEDGMWFSYPEKPTKDETKWILYTTPPFQHEVIAEDDYPKDFNGSWEESLFMNPKYQDNEYPKH